MSTSRIMPFFKIDIDKIKYINILQKNKKVLAFKEANSYIELNTLNLNKRFTYNNNEVEVIATFSDLLSEASLDVLLINDFGKIESNVTKSQAYYMLCLYDKINNMDSGILERVEDIAGVVADKICENLKISEVNINDLEDEIILGLLDFNRNEFCSNLIGSMLMEEQAFFNLLKDYIRLELITNLKNDNKISICKEGSHVDYKINIILKYLNKCVNLSEINDFIIEYNMTGAEYKDYKGTINLFNKSDNKVKKFVDKH